MGTWDDYGFGFAEKSLKYLGNCSRNYMRRLLGEFSRKVSLTFGVLIRFC